MGKNKQTIKENKGIKAAVRISNSGNKQEASNIYKKLLIKRLLNLKRKGRLGLDTTLKTPMQQKIASIKDWQIKFGNLILEKI